MNETELLIEVDPPSEITATVDDFTDEAVVEVDLSEVVVSL